MTKRITIQVILMSLMMVSALLAYLLVPHHKIAESRNITLEKAIPSNFANWTIEPNQSVIEVPAEMQATIDKIYSETISRTYKNEKGQRVMLVIAYGKDQGDSNSVHRPEVCYPAQGFAVDQKEFATFEINERKIDVIRLVAKTDSRTEPITYWITVADYLITNGLDGKLAQLNYGLRGQIPDGLLMRISSIGANKIDEYGMQQEFISDLYQSLPQTERNFIFGKSSFNSN